jgi:hypothetical protein
MPSLDNFGSGLLQDLIDLSIRFQFLDSFGPLVSEEPLLLVPWHRETEILKGMPCGYATLFGPS